MAEEQWRVSWMANGAGTVMGADVGGFAAKLEGKDIVMRSEGGPGGMGLQRVVFHEIGDDAFRWRSEYSTDEGKTWTTIMRMHARRVQR